MSPNQLAGLVSLTVAFGTASAWLITRRVMRRPAIAGTGVVIVATWTLFAGGFPYAIFALGVSSARGHGTLTGIASVVIGFLPLILIAAPITGLIFTIRHFTLHLRRHFSVDLHGGTIPEPTQDRSHEIRDRDTRDSPTAPNRAQNQGHPRDSRQ